ncbi:hypothetical protein [Streptomyces sp. NPDC007346]|uniref:hypothetical protein n=1 Tax=Streptomyces sp. NPDC007346 TaxID=3154682 RepID=UPI0034561010
MSGIYDDGAQYGPPPAALTEEEADSLRWLWKITFGYDAAHPLHVYADQPGFHRSHRAAFKNLAQHASRGVDTRELAEALNLSPDVIRGCLDIASAHQASVKATQDRLGITGLIAPLHTSESARAFLFAARDSGCTTDWWETVGLFIDAAISVSDQPDYDNYDDLASEAWMAVEGPIRAAVATIATEIDIDELSTWYDACDPRELRRMPDFEALETQEDIHDAFMAVALNIAQEFIGNTAAATSVRHLVDAEAYDFIAAPLVRAHEATIEQ